MWAPSVHVAISHVLNGVVISVESDYSNITVLKLAASALGQHFLPSTATMFLSVYTEVNVCHLLRGPRTIGPILNQLEWKSTCLVGYSGHDAHSSRIKHILLAITYEKLNRKAIKHWLN